MSKNRLLTFFLVLLTSQVGGFAATHYAASLAYGDVLAAVNAAETGDLVRLPAGAVTWTNESLSMSKRVAIQGAGIGQTVLRRGAPEITTPLFTWTGSASPEKVWGLSHLTIDANKANANYGMVNFGGFYTTNRNFRFHNLAITNIWRRGILTIGWSSGLIDNCYFELPHLGTGQAVTIFGRVRSGASVTNNALSATVVGLGQIEGFVYVEDCVFDFAYRNDAAVEVYYDGQAVLRYNQVTNTCFGIHENGLNNRSGTVWEVYGNTFYDKPNAPSHKSVGWLFIRSGWGVVWSNTVAFAPTTTYTTSPHLMLYRASGTNVFANYYPGPAITGTNRLDGNQNHITIGYPAWDQPGWGDPTVWTATNSNHTFHGCYSWSNTVNGSNVGYTVKDFSVRGTQNEGLLAYDGVSWVPTSQQLIVKDRDFFNDTPKPSYTPLAYPHPLATSGGALPVTPPGPLRLLDP